MSAAAVAVITDAGKIALAASVCDNVVPATMFEPRLRPPRRHPVAQVFKTMLGGGLGAGVVVMIIVCGHLLQAFLHI